MDFLDLSLAQNKHLLTEAREALASPYKVPEEARKQALIQTTQDDNARVAFAAARTPRIRLNVLAQNMAMDFFEYVSLGDNEIPQWVAESDMPTSVTVLSEYGGHASQIWTGEQSIASWSVYMLASKKIYVPRFSVIQGNIRESDRANARASYDMNRKIDKDLMTLLTASLGNFGTDTWLLDEDIQNMPTTNDLDWSADLNGKLTKDFFIRLFDHFDRLGKTIKNIYVATTVPKTIWEWVSVTSGYDTGSVQPENTVDPVTQREIIKSGRLQSMFGRSFNLVPKNTLNGAAGSNYVWVSTTEPAGFFFEKPSMAGTDTLNDRLPFFEGFASRMVIGQGIPAPFKPNFARIKIG